MIDKNSIELKDLLSRVQHTRGSEIQTGARALLNPSPLNDALSSVSGRMLARTIRYMGFPQSAQNFIASRVPFIVYLILEHIPPEVAAPLIVDIFAGFSPIGYHVARQVPQCTYVDLASQSNIAELQRRLKRAQNRGVQIPPNYFPRGIDYGTQSLESVLKRPVNVLLANSTYYNWDENVLLLRHLRDSLVDGGALITSFAAARNVEAIRQALGFFRSQVGYFSLEITDETQIHDLLGEAGLRNVRVWRASTVGESLGLPQPVLDLEWFAVGQR